MDKQTFNRALFTELITPKPKPIPLIELLRKQEETFRKHFVSDCLVIEDK